MATDEKPDVTNDAPTGDIPATLKDQRSLAEIPASLPNKVGDYALKRVIASGGMGTVFLAVQEHPRRTVALKMMKRGLTAKSALRRFEFESQILARLRHPNIAQVYEAGTYDDGEGSVPYFAMEYIANAKSVTEHVTAKKLSTRARLELYVKICQEVKL